MDKLKALHTMEHLLEHAEKQFMAENFDSAARCYNQWDAIGQKYFGKSNYFHLENTNRLYYKNVSEVFMSTTNNGYVIDPAGFANLQVGDLDKSVEWSKKIALAYKNRSDAKIIVRDVLDIVGLQKIVTG